MKGPEMFDDMNDGEMPLIDMDLLRGLAFVWGLDQRHLIFGEFFSAVMHLPEPERSVFLHVQGLAVPVEGREELLERLNLDVAYFDFIRESGTRMLRYALKAMEEVLVDS